MHTDFSRRLLHWFDRHGRKDLPWQRSRDPYRIWVSEIMLQQTQVNTVIPYYNRFLERFPDIAALAAASQDEVLHRWTGLGYYARGRNLHKAAQIILQQHAGTFPTDLDSVCALPGIGRSTAGAILAFAHGQRHTILDGNVKRVLTRYHALAGWPGGREVETQLWQLAELHTPADHLQDYTQAIMDLGATVCRRSKPLCPDCPLAGTCQAHAQGNPQAYPTGKPRQALPEKHVTMLMIRNHQGHVLLQQRPPMGIWGGLWGFPECAPPDETAQWCRDTLGLEVAMDTPWPALRHTFSHFHLHITPIPARVSGENGGSSGKIMEPAGAVWYNLNLPDERGLAAPVKNLLEQLSALSTRHG
jgi:A/G-specific adenine glycosylase